MAEEEREFHKMLIQFPFSFSLEIEELNKIKHIESHKKKLELKCETNEFETTVEWIRVNNLLSFLHWKAEKTDNAYEHNRKALDLDKNNIVALCNRAWMQWEGGHYTEAYEELTQVKKIAESRKDLLFQGKAEIAYSYSTFGPRYFSLSINMYNQLLLEIVEKDIDAKLVQLWKLDLGITYRKFCNSGNVLPKPDWRERNMDDCIEKTALIFNEIVNSGSPARWKGRCYASLAELAFSISTNIHHTKSQKDLFPNEIADTKLETFLHLALSACDKDSHVLRVCGKLFKYLGQLDKAEEILRKSLSIMETSYGHHHLAMVLKKNLMNRIKYGLDITDTKHPTGSVIEVDLAPHSFDGKYGQQSKTTPHDPSFTRLQSHSLTIFQKEAAKAYSDVVDIPADENDAVKEIMLHLDKAIGFGNEWASFEKGLMFRQTGEHKKAFETFRNTLSMKYIGTSTVTVACYEHLGTCSRDLAKKELNPEDKRKLEADAIMYFRKAVEIAACKASQELRFLKDGWMAYTTLKDMFQSQMRDVQKLKVVAELSNLLGKYGETLGFYQQIIELDETQANDPSIIRGKIKILMDEGNFEQAAMFLDLYQCTEGKYQISQEYYKMVYLKCAFGLVSSDKKEESGKRFRQAFDVGYASKSKEEPDFDIIFLYDEEIETTKTGNHVNASELANKLKDILGGNSGLKTTSNSENVNPGRWKRESQAEQMLSSANIILILDTNEKPRGELEYFIKIAQEIDKEKKSKLSLIIVDGYTCPIELIAFQRVDFETILMHRHDDFIVWAQKLLTCLLDVKESDD